ncbi:MAG: flagellar motor switch phosphatase FliY [Lachnospiraceae bacterium]|nr:flagellar motor switch phosphatase FliY [Lachnospiraceae bacterium]
MDGMLSQDEINALLSGMSPADSAPAEESTPAEESASAPEAAPAKTPNPRGVVIDESLLTDVEKDAIGEVANISMGTSATTLFSLVNQKVNITTPVVKLATWEDVLQYYERPCVFIQIKYTTGLDGSNILILKEHDVKIITDLMMGGDGSNTEGELGELHLSAISEAMNQMMGSAATSLSQMLGSMIDISPPIATLVDLQDFRMDDDIASFLNGVFVRIAFHMQIGTLVDSTILQLYPVDFAKTLVDNFLNDGPPSAPEAPAPQPAAAPAMAPQSAPMDMGAMQQPMQQQPMPMPEMMPQGMPMMQQGMPMMQPNMGMMPQMMPMMAMPQPEQMANINYQPAQFQSFAQNINPAVSTENINLIMDVPLQVTVELGRTSKSISEILDFAPGTIIELDKIAGEPVDVLVNGKFVAKGEVVVIEESFGIRVTDIIR